MKAPTVWILGRYLLLACIVCSFPFSSCEWFKPARDSEKEKVYTEEDLGDIQGTRVFDPETGEWRTVREVGGSVDTVQWRELSEKDYPPIMTDGTWANAGQPATGTGPIASGSRHNIALLLPFLANQSSFGEIDPNSNWAIHFYAGAKLAYEDLADEGISLAINVKDSGGSTGSVSNMIRNNIFNNSELVIGPYKRDNVKLMENFSAINKIPLVIPYNAQQGMAQNNPGYVQINPSLKSHCEAITKHARLLYDTENIVLVGRDRPEEKARFSYFQEANQNIAETPGNALFREYVIGYDEYNQIDLDIAPYIRQGETNVFIVPSWSDESFVYSVLRELVIEQTKGEEIIVYGMPQWIDYEQVDYDFFKKLNVHVSSAFYLDTSDERVRQFRQKFFDTYAAIPNDEAYLGYDIMLYFGKMVNRYGREFPQNIDREQFDVLRGRFEFKRVVLEPEKHREDLNYYDQLENKFVHILQFRDFQFQPTY